MSRNATQTRCTGVSRNATQIRLAGAQEFLVKPVRFEELKRAVSSLISAVREKAFEARRAPLAAIREELAVWQTENTGRIENAKKKALRVKAEMAFLAAGGARGDFAPEWLSGFFWGKRVAPIHPPLPAAEGARRIESAGA